MGILVRLRVRVFLSVQGPPVFGVFECSNVFECCSEVTSEVYANPLHNSMTKGCVRETCSRGVSECSQTRVRESCARVAFWVLLCSSAS